MLVFTKLLLIFAVMLLIFGVVIYYIGYHFSGNTSLNYYPKNQSSNFSSPQQYSNFIQNGSTTIKYFGTFLLLFFFIFVLGAGINEYFRFSDKLHHLKKQKPLH